MKNNGKKRAQHKTMQTKIPENVEKKQRFLKTHHHKWTINQWILKRRLTSFSMALPARNALSFTYELRSNNPPGRMIMVKWWRCNDNDDCYNSTSTHEQNVFLTGKKPNDLKNHKWISCVFSNTEDDFTEEHMNMGPSQLKFGYNPFAPISLDITLDIPVS